MRPDIGAMDERLRIGTHDQRFAAAGIAIAVGEVGARIAGADPGRNDPGTVIGLIVLAGASVMILRSDERGRYPWVAAGFVMFLFALARPILIGRPIQSAALAILGLALMTGAEESVRPEGHQPASKMRAIARTTAFDLALIPLAFFALFPVGVARSPQGALANTAAREGFSIPASRIASDMVEVDAKHYAMGLPNHCTVTVEKVGGFWHPTNDIRCFR